MVTEILSPDALIESLFTQSPYPIWISDNRGTLIKINPSCLKLLKITEEEVLGSYNILEDNVVAEQGFLPLVRRVFEEGETARFEIRYDSSRVEHLRLAQAASVILDVTIFPIRNAGGEVTNAVIQHVDITSRRIAEEKLRDAFAELEERVRERSVDLVAANEALRKEVTEHRLAEAELRRSEEQFRILCQSAPIGIYKTDKDGIADFVNRKLLKILGVSEGELLVDAWRRMLHPEDRDRVVKLWEDAVAERRPFFAEYRFQTPHRDEVVVRSLARPISVADGTFSGYVGTVEDVTEVARSREEMLKTQKLESLGVLAGGIAHDFNNLLMIILGYVSIAHTRADSPEVVRRRLEDAEKAIMRARDLTYQLITFARGGDPVKKMIELNHVLEEAARFASFGSTASCEFHLAPDLAPVEADEGQLSQVIHNLVINASQAMPGGGRITISSENTVAPKTGQKMVKVAVHDTGTGILPQHRAKIFDPYFTTKQQGSGLGLASCYSIIRKHGGIIVVDSVVGAGSTFTIFLPAAENASVGSTTESSTVSPGHGRILVMDDDASVAEIALSMLEELGYEAEWVANGNDAIDLYRTRREEGRPFSAVIMDLTIQGGMGGKEAVAALTAYDPGAQVAVSSGYSTDPVLANCGRYGFRAALTKPYTLQEMAAVMTALHHQQAQDPDRRSA